MDKDLIKEAETRVYIHSSFNNTIVTVTNRIGDTLFSCSGGMAGFKGSRRSTAHAAKQAAEKVGKKAREAGLIKVDLYLKGIGKGRYTVAKGLRAAGLKVQSIKDITPIAFNGCRPPKRRRI